MFLADVTAEVIMNDIPDDLIINWDQTALQFVPTGQWTMLQSGDKVIPISHSDNKCQITAVLAAIMKGEYLTKSIINEKYSNVTHNLTFLRGGTSGIWRITGQMKTLCIAILRRLLFHLLKRGLLLSCPPHSSAYSV